MMALNLKAKWDLNKVVWVNEDKLPGFRELLESWVNVHRKCCDGIWPDLYWEYSERPQIGFLSNAAVLIDGIALEEWHVRKRSGRGRNDLWLRLNPNSNAIDYQIEAKYSKLHLRKSIGESEQTIIQTMSDARESAEKLYSDNRETNVAMSFLTLKFGNKDTGELDNKIRELLRHTQERSRHEINLDAIAAIWLGTKDFQLCRNERKRIAEEKNAKEWANNEVGLILLASRMD